MTKVKYRKHANTLYKFLTEFFPDIAKLTCLLENAI